MRTKYTIQFKKKGTAKVITKEFHLHKDYISSFIKKLVGYGHTPLHLSDEFGNTLFSRQRS